MIPEYPSRPRFFAYRLTRLMFKTALANEIGPDACYLIAQVAFTEDATRYSKPVTFWNEQLLPVCGLKSVKSLATARAKAVESGWLIYEQGGKGRAGKYWTTIPPQYADMDDGSIDETAAAAELVPAVSIPFVCANGTENGETTATERQQNGETTAKQTQTFYPNPYPNPNTVCTEPEIPAAVPEIIEDAFLKFDCTGKQPAWVLTNRQVEEWSTLFPGLDVAQQCRAAKAWADANRNKRKTAGGMSRFLVSWLTREQNRGHSVAPLPPTPPKPFKQRLPTDEELKRWNPYSPTGFDPP